MKYFTTKAEEDYYNQLQEAVVLLNKIVDWTDTHEIWWLNCSDKGGIDMKQIVDFISKTK